ncbi:heavy metal translocating P-type ATPase [Undibacterium sp. 5I1]|uniref:heavy metal translocating P-type ATPase n=1 Tax=unclassified Undibacterium TaxID=2630295 RepID=UPI002AB3BB1F|nr:MULTISPECIES: heavy metal translocating P-type ATPase [unclassified Undibacterium]MDY7536712.1 heavy metal translocating P-type ATPase [Undibacterium sp. 5I1]MEB0230243.1 heavy metal translocating P-type ATPase [Undibacterium sp. 10I3]MEB0257943.1 heavy metal translocating P-type ATPase [Undibacterium sp. 5I1]
MNQTSQKTDDLQGESCCGVTETTAQQKSTPVESNEKNYIDPVCGMQVRKNPEKMARYQGIAYYFCSQSCISKFNANPDGFVKAKKLIGGSLKSTQTVSTANSATACCGGNSDESSTSQNSVTQHTDPVCKMSVKEDSQHHYRYQDQTYYFCCAGCLNKFSKDPQKYLTPKTEDASKKPVAKDAIYTCPMHLEIQQVGPGTCPKCGMALEPMEASAEEDTTELDDMTRRFKISVALSIPLLLLSMGDMLPALQLHERLGMRLFSWLQFGLATPVVLWSGKPFFERAVASFKSGHLNMFSLIGIGTATAYLFSVVALLLPQILPAAFLMDGMAPLYFEAAGVIITLVLLGQVLELRARSRTNAALKSLLALTPATAFRLDAESKETEISIDQVQLKDLLRVKPGAHVPVDGVVVDGRSNVDESMITGEPLPVTKQINDHVSAGTINQQGSFSIRVERIGHDTLLSKIIQLVNEAGRSRAPIQSLADKVSGWFVPGVIGIAVIAFIVWAWLGPAPAMANALMAAVSVLIVACPCALGLATPISITVGIGRGATDGILIKDAQALEQMEKIDTLVIDKTGTLTEGKPTLQQIVATNGVKEQSLIEIACAIEQQSEHPLAHAILSYAKQHQVKAATISEFAAITGKGVSAQWEGKRVLFGNQQLMRDHQIQTLELDKRIAELQGLGHTVMLLSLDDVLAGAISVADSIKSTSLQAIQQLKESGLRIIVLSGDNALTAKAVASQLGLAEVHADVLPEDKFRFIKQLQGEGRIVAMAGDGINDAPALAQADVGIAMGNGTDIAMNSAKVVLVKGDLVGIFKARSLSQHTMKNIRQNLFFAFAYNFIGVPIAAGVLYPWFGILLSPMIASAAMSLSSVSVIGNALRLRHAKL